MATLTCLTHAQVAAILRAYEVGELIGAMPMAGGAANSSHHLKTDRGDFILTVCDEKPREDVEGLVALLVFLEGADFPTTRVVPCADGSRVSSHDAKPVILKEFVEGHTLEQPDPMILAQLGATMAKLHALSAPDRLPQTFSYGIDQFDTFPSSKRSTAFGKWLSHKTNTLGRRLPADLPTGLIHGDLFPDNVICHRGRIAAVIDFEEACRYFLAFDLGMALVGLLALSPNLPISTHRTFVDGYQSVRPLTDAEKRSLQAFSEYAAVATAFWRYRQYRIVNPDPEKADHHTQMVGIADRIETISGTEFGAALGVGPAQ